MKGFNPFRDSTIEFPEESVSEKGAQPKIVIPEHYKRVLKHQFPIDPKTRVDNIITVNDWQGRELWKYGAEISLNGNHEWHRKLAAYYRPTQVDYASQVQIQEIMQFLRYYVEQGYSILFDEFAVFYRFPDRDILKEFERNSYRSTGLDFQVLSSVYANTIHFSDGSPDFAPGTIPILGEIPHKRWQAKRDQCVRLPISYYPVDKICHKRGVVTKTDIKHAHKALLDPTKLIPVLNIALETIRKTEEVMLQQAMH